MAAISVVMPILPGQEDAARAFAREVAGPRADEFAEFQSVAGNTTRETWHLLDTPNGSVFAVWFEAADPEGGFEQLASAGGFAQWFREQIQEVTGIDMSQPDAGPSAELLLDWKA